MKRNRSGQVLIILLGSLLMGGSGVAVGLFLTGKTSSEMRKDTLAMVEDAGRRDKIKAVFKRWEDEVKRMDKTRNKRIDELAALMRRHDARPADFDPIFATFDETQEQAFETALAMRFALREQLSAEEWRQLFPPAVSDKDDVSARVNAPRSDSR
jgi:hypothetical protein